MNKQQKELIEKRLKELKKSKVFCGCLIVSGCCFVLSIFGLPLGALLIIIGNILGSKIRKEEFELRLKYNPKEKVKKSIFKNWNRW